VDAPSQSKAEVAINEAERLLNVEKVDILAGVYSSAHAVPLAEKVDKQKRFLWITTAISSKVFDGRNLQYTFRPQPTGIQFGELSVDYVAAFSESKLKKAPKDLRLAIIYEDGAYGSDVGLGNELKAKEMGLNVVLKEGYSINAPDLSSLVTKLRSARPDVLFHTGYNPDISLFLRQAKEQGLRVRAYIGHGAGHSQLDKLKEAFGKEVEWFHTLDPIASQLLDAKKLKPGVGDLTAEMVKRYKTLYDPNVQTNAIAPHVSMGFNNLWVLFNDVLPRAIQKHGGFGPDALAKAARETDIPEGGTMQGYGVKFHPPGHAMAGQNERAFPAERLAATYHERWEIETALDELKTHLRGAQIVLRSKTPELVRQEFFGLLMAHFAIRGLMHEAALKADEDPDRLSFLTPGPVARRGMPPNGARQLLAIGDTARTALTEMRRLLGVLREDTDTDTTRQPQDPRRHRARLCLLSAAQGAAPSRIKAKEMRCEASACRARLRRSACRGIRQQAGRPCACPQRPRRRRS